MKSHGAVLFAAILAASGMIAVIVGAETLGLAAMTLGVTGLPIALVWRADERRGVRTAFSATATALLVTITVVFVLEAHDDVPIVLGFPLPTTLVLTLVWGVPLVACLAWRRREDDS